MQALRPYQKEEGRGSQILQCVNASNVMECHKTRGVGEML